MPFPPQQRELFDRGRRGAPQHSEAQKPAPGEAWARALRRRWGLMALVWAGSMAAAVAALWCLPARYQAEARVTVQRRAPALQFANPSAAPPSPPGTAMVQTVAEELSGPALVGSALASMGAQANLLLAPPLRHPGWLARRWRPTATSGARLLAVRRHLHITVAAGSRVLLLRFSAPRPELGAAFLRSLLAAFLHQTAARQRAGALGQVALLQTQAQQARTRVRRAMQSLAALAAQKGLMDPAAQLEAASARWRQLAAAETSAEVEQLQQADRLAEHAAAQPPGSPGPQALEAQRAQLAARVQALTAEYRPQALPLRQARLRLAALDANLQAWRQRQQQQQQSALAAVRRQTRDLGAALERQQRLTSTLETATGDFDLAQRQVDARRQIYASLLGQLQQAIAAVGATEAPLRAEGSPAAMAVPLSPRWWPALASAWVLGLALGLAAAWMADSRDDRLRFPEARELGVTLAAALPRWGPDRGQRLGLIAGAPSPSFRRAAAGCAAALLGARQASGWSVVLVSSADGGEGKTMLALHLAAQLGRQAPVLLLDAHTARPALHERCGGPATPGLAELLAGRAQVEQVLHPAGPGVSRIGAGEGSEDLPLALAGGAGADLLRAARARFDWVIVDGPPALSGPEAGLWAGLADATLLVARYGHTRRRALRRSLDALESAGGGAIAVVLNFVPAGSCEPWIEVWRPLGARAEAGEPIALRRRA
ncbi:MAG: GumC family protein [Terriglobales bacterium]